MPQSKPQAAPGFISQATQVQAKGNWFAGNLVRWRFGLLEKIGGWRRLIEDLFAAPIRKLHAWSDLQDVNNLMVATDLGLQLVANNKLYGMGSELTLQGGFIPTGAPTDATKFSVTGGSKTVTVKTTAAVSAGGTAMFALPISVGGRIIPAGSFFTIKSVTLGVSFTFDMPMPALSTETDTYGVRLYTNDLPDQMTVTWKAHGLSPGDLFEVAQTTTLKTSAVDFTAPADRLFRISTVPTPDTFVFFMQAAGHGDGAGGVSHQVYEGTQISGAGTSVGTVIAASVLTPLGDPQKQGWYLANFGEKGLALATGSQMQVYNPPIENGPWVSPVPTAPARANGMLVAMPQAQVIVWGTDGVLYDPDSQDPLMLRWSHPGTLDFNILTSGGAASQAGSLRLSRGSKIMGAIQAPQMTLVWTDTDLWSMSYIGPPLVYGFTIIARGCGLDAPNDAAVIGNQIVWKSKKNFWTLGASGAQVMPCSVWDFAFNNIDEFNINKSFAAPNSSATEIGFWFAAKSKAKQIDDETAGDNLLLFSGDLDNATRWMLTGVGALHPSLFKQVYVYEEQYEKSGWFDPSGMNANSWLDPDLQMKLEQVIFAPDGSDTAISLQEFAVNGLHQMSQTILKPSESKTYTLSVYAHTSSTRNLTLRATSFDGIGAYATFDVSGVLLASGVTAPSFAVQSAVVLTDALGTGANGWRRFVMTFATDDKSKLEVAFNCTNGTNIGYLGDTTKGLLIWGPQLVVGSKPGEYQVSSGFQLQNEPTLYVKYNILDNAWDSGALPRTAWIDDSVFGPPLAGDANLRVQQHEVGFDDDDQPMRGVFAETGYSEIGDGSVMLSIDQCQPDFKWFGRNGAMKVYLRAVQYAQGPEHLFGPWSMTPGTQFFCPRVRAHYVAIRYEWEPLRGYSSRVGVPSFQTKPAGRRP